MHVCNDMCRNWHTTHKPRGQKTNSMPAGDPSHLPKRIKNDPNAMKKIAENKTNKRY